VAPGKPGLPAISGYRVIERLGGGGMGEVFLAEDESLGRQVAIKAISPAGSAGGWDEGESRERLVREARAMASLSHPHLVQVHTLVRHAERDYLVMELVRGGTLEDRILTDGPMPPEDALTLVRQVSDALAAAWDRGIVHRDIKPANILLDESGKAKVADFGLAKPLDGAESLRITQTGTMVGTPCYMSPEHAGEGEVGFRSDIYSLGLVLYEMLTGRPPFEKMGYLTVVARHIAGDLPDLAAARSAVPEKVVELYKRMTRRDPAQRQVSYAALREEIDAALASLREPSFREIAAAPREAAKRAGPRVLIWSLAIVLLAAAGGFGGWWFFHERAVKKPGPAPQPTPGKTAPVPVPRPAPAPPPPLRDQASPDTPASALAGLLTRLGTGSFGLRLETAGGRLEAHAQKEAGFILFLLTNTGDLLLLHPSDLEPGPPFPPGSPLVIDRPAQASPGWAVLVATPRSFEPPIVLGARPEVDHILYPQRVGKRDFVYPAFDYLSWLVDRLRQDAGTWDVAVRPL
jgi:Protein kinase domain